MFKAIVVALFALVMSSGVAHADTLDDQYLKLLASHGIEGDPAQLIASGHDSCDALDQGRIGYGVSPYGLAMMKITGQLMSQGLSSQQVSQLTHDANTVYCPGKA